MDFEEVLQEAFSKLMVFRKFLFSLINILKEPRLGEFLNELGRRFQHKTALCLKDKIIDLPISVLSLGISMCADFLKL